MRCAHDDLHGDCVCIVCKRLKDVFRIELLHTVQTIRHLRIEFAFSESGEVAVPNALVGEQVVTALMRIQAFKTHGTKEP